MFAQRLWLLAGRFAYAAQKACAGQADSALPEKAELISSMRANGGEYRIVKFQAKRQLFIYVLQFGASYGILHKLNRESRWGALALAGRSRVYLVNRPKKRQKTGIAQTVTCPCS